MTQQLAVRVRLVRKLEWTADLMAVAPSGTHVVCSETRALPLFAVSAVLGDVKCAAAITQDGRLKPLEKNPASQSVRARELLRLALGTPKNPVGRPPTTKAPRRPKRDPCAPRKTVLRPGQQPRRGPWPLRP